MPPKLDEYLTHAWEVFFFLTIVVLPLGLVGYLTYAIWRSMS